MATPQVFESNSDQETVIYNRLENPVITQFVRLNPKTWNEAIAIRTEFYGYSAGMLSVINYNSCFLCGTCWNLFTQCKFTQ